MSLFTGAMLGCSSAFSGLDGSGVGCDVSSGSLGRAAVDAVGSLESPIPPSIQMMSFGGGFLASTLQRISAIKTAMCARLMIVTFRQKRASRGIVTSTRPSSRYRPW